MVLIEPVVEAEVEATPEETAEAESEAKEAGAGAEEAEAEPTPEDTAEAEAAAQEAGAEAEEAAAETKPEGEAEAECEAEDAEAEAKEAEVEPTPEEAEASRKFNEAMGLFAGAEEDVEEVDEAAEEARAAEEAEAAEKARDDEELEDIIATATAEAEALPRERATVSLDEPGLQLPKPAKSDWKAEMASIKMTVGNGGTGKHFHDDLILQIEDIRAMEDAQIHFQKKLDAVQAEATRCRNEEKRNSAMKGTLEATCRVLQEQRRSIARENQKIADEEKTRHAELKDKFEQAIKDVQEKMDAEYEVRQHFVKENDELRTKLQKFTETFDEQEKHVAQQQEAREKERELKKTRLKEYESVAPKAKVKADQLEKENKALRTNQAILKEELQHILAKFDEFHLSVTGSNEQHSDCKSEIDKMQSELTGLENDNAVLRANAQLQEMEKEREVARKQRDALDKLYDNLNKSVKSVKAAG